MATRSSVAYDHALMWSSNVGKAGMPDPEKDDLLRDLRGVKDALAEQRRRNAVGFFEIPELVSDVRDAERMAKEVSKKFRTLIVIGIGGSDLGSRTLVKALAKKGKGMDVRFIGANTDPEELAELLTDVDLRKSCLNIVSKSGDTIEPMSAFVLLRDRLIKKVGAKRHAAHVVATTDRKKGTLRQICDREGYRTLPVPERIGGRFSALTAVGLFPAFAAGIPARRLLEGARRERDLFFAGQPADSGPLLFAGLQHRAYRDRGQRVTVLMPYGASLKEFGAWFRQLWAESLGKRRDRKGIEVNHGFTPVAALGATDQHSQVQLYNEGPADKTVTFIEVGEFRKDFAVPNPYPDIEGVAYMAGNSFGDIIHAEREATARALAGSGKPSGTLRIEGITPESVGGIMMFFMLSTAAMGELLDVDAYDQPGVEEGKRTMYALLGRKGYALS